MSILEELSQSYALITTSSWPSPSRSEPYILEPIWSQYWEAYHLASYEPDMDEVPENLLGFPYTR